MKKSLSFSVSLILLSYLFFSFSYKKNLHFKQINSTKPTVIGKWVGKFATLSNKDPYIDQYWELTSDNKIVVYSTTKVPKQFSDYEGVWEIQQNVFKATFIKSSDPNFVFTDAGILSSNFDRIDGLETFGTNTCGQSQFFMQKQ